MKISRFTFRNALALAALLFLCTVHVSSASDSAPGVTLTCNRTVQAEPGSVILTATAAGVAISKVEFHADGDLLDWKTDGPYVTQWDWIPAGIYVFTARAYDGGGLVTESDPIIVTVTEDTDRPTVAIIAPDDESTVSGTIQVAATAADDAGVGAGGVVFQVDDVDTFDDDEAPFQCALDTTKLSDGTHTISAVAWDWSGKYGSYTTTVTVNNAPSGGGPNEGDPTVTLDVISGLTGVQRETVNGQEILFTQSTEVSVTVSATTPTGTIDAITVRGGDADRIITGNGAASLKDTITVPVSEGRITLIATSSAGGSSKPITLIVDRAPPRIAWVQGPAFADPDYSKPLRISLTDERDYVVLNGNSETGDTGNAALRGGRGLNVYNRDGFAATGVIDDLAGLSSASPDAPRATLVGAEEHELSASLASGVMTITGFAGLPESVTYDAQTLAASEVAGSCRLHLKLTDRCGNVLHADQFAVWVDTKAPTAKLGRLPYSSTGNSRFEVAPEGQTELAPARVIVTTADTQAAVQVVSGSSLPLAKLLPTPDSLPTEPNGTLAVWSLTYPIRPSNAPSGITVGSVSGAASVRLVDCFGNLSESISVPAQLVMLDEPALPARPPVGSDPIHRPITKVVSQQPFFGDQVCYNFAGQVVVAQVANNAAAQFPHFNAQFRNYGACQLDDLVIHPEVAFGPPAPPAVAFSGVLKPDLVRYLGPAPTEGSLVVPRVATIPPSWETGPHQLQLGMADTSLNDPFVAPAPIPAKQKVSEIVQNFEEERRLGWHNEDQTSTSASWDEERQRRGALLEEIGYVPGYPQGSPPTIYDYKVNIRVGYLVREDPFTPNTGDSSPPTDPTYGVEGTAPGPETTIEPGDAVWGNLDVGLTQRQSQPLQKQPFPPGARIFSMGAFSCDRGNAAAGYARFGWSRNGGISDFIPARKGGTYRASNRVIADLWGFGTKAEEWLPGSGIPRPCDCGGLPMHYWELWEPNVSNLATTAYLGWPMVPSRTSTQVADTGFRWANFVKLENDVVTAGPTTLRITGGFTQPGLTAPVIAPNGNYVSLHAIDEVKSVPELAVARLDKDFSTDQWYCHTEANEAFAKASEAVAFAKSTLDTERTDLIQRRTEAEAKKTAAQAMLANPTPGANIAQARRDYDHAVSLLESTMPLLKALQVTPTTLVQAQSQLNQASSLMPVGDCDRDMMGRFKGDQVIAYARQAITTARNAVQSVVPYCYGVTLPAGVVEHPEACHDKIVILGSRLRTDGVNASLTQTLEVDVMIGDEVPMEQYHVDVNCLGIREYTDALSQLTAGANGAHRMKGALNVVQLQAVNSEGPVAMMTATSRPAPAVHIDSLDTYDIQNPNSGLVQFTLKGFVTDSIADITPGNAADIKEITVGDQTFPVTREAESTNDPWRPYAAKYKYEAPVVMLIHNGDNQVTVETKNALGMSGYAGLAVRAKVTLADSPTNGSTQSSTVVSGGVLHITVPEATNGSEPGSIKFGTRQPDGTITEATLPRTESGIYSGTILQFGNVTVAIPVPLLLTSSRDAVTFTLTMPQFGIDHVDQLLIETSETSDIFESMAPSGGGSGSNGGGLVPLEIAVQSVQMHEDPTPAPENILRVRYRNVMDQSADSVIIAGRSFALIDDPDHPGGKITKDPVMFVGTSVPASVTSAFQASPNKSVVTLNRRWNNQDIQGVQGFALAGDPKQIWQGDGSLHWGARPKIPRGVNRVMVGLRSDAWRGLVDIQKTGLSVHEIDENDLKFRLVDDKGVVDPKVTITDVVHKKGDPTLILQLSADPSHDIGKRIGIKGRANVTDAGIKNNTDRRSGFNGKRWIDLDARDFWEVVDLRIVILALDGGGYHALKDAIDQGSPNGFFKKVFGSSGDATYDPGPALNSLPTVTFTNWATWQTGQTPAQHGILGNAFFPRDRIGEAHGIGLPFGCSNRIAGKDINLHIRTNGVATIAFREGSFDDTDNLRAAELNRLVELLKDPAAFLYSDTARLTKSISFNNQYNDIPQGISGHEGVSFGAVVSEAMSDKLVDHLNGQGSGRRPARVGLVEGLNTVTSGVTHFVQHGPVSAKILDQKTRKDAVEHWHRGKPANVQFLYFPGPDNYAHDPTGTNQGVAFKNPNIGIGGSSQDKAITHQIVQVTDLEIRKVWDEIIRQGYRDAVVFAAIADHGLIVTPHQRMTDENTIHADGTPETNEAENGPIVHLLTQAYRSIQLRDNNGLPFTPNVWRGGVAPIEESQIVNAPSGGLNHVYMAQYQTRADGVIISDWKASADRANIMSIAQVLRNESLGVTTAYRDRNAASPSPRQDQTFQGALADLNGNPAVLIKVNGFGDQYHVFTGNSSFVDLPPNMGPAGGTWTDATNRMLNETNDTGNASRSGEIVLLMNSINGTIAVAEGDQLPGWHGSPSKTESEVPMMWNFPGSSPTGIDGLQPSDLSDRIKSVLQGIQGSGQLRSWQFKGVVYGIIDKVRAP